MDTGSRRIYWLFATVTLFGAAVVAAFIYRFGVDAPIIDEWNYLAEYDLWRQGRFGWFDCLALHNGHRPFLPRLAFFLLAEPTGWNERFFMFVGLVIAALALILLARHLARRSQSAVLLHDIALALACSALVFSLAQWENWLMGFQINVFLAVTGTIAAMYFLADGPETRPRLALAIASALVATLSSAAGLIAWPCGLAVLAWHWWIARRNVSRLLIWSSVAVVTYSLYFAHWTPGSGGSSTGYELTHPLAVTYFWFSVLGNPLAAYAGSSWPPEDHGVAFVIGLAGVLWLKILTSRLLREPATREGMAFPLALCLFGFGAAALATLGRVEGGGAAAYASRYATLVVPFWLGLCLLGSETSTAVPKSRLMRVTHVTILVAILLATLLDAWAARSVIERSRMLGTARSELLRGQVKDYLFYLHPGDPEAVKTGRDILKKYHLSVFRNPGTIQLPVIPRPLDDFRASITADGDPPVRVTASSAFRVPVEVRNTSSEPWAWFGAKWQESVQIAYHWYDQKGKAVVFDSSRTPFPHDIFPGESVRLPPVIVAPAQAGHYILEITLVQEGVAWFDQRGNPGLRLPIEVVR